ncbi:hypothetical protein TWF694_006303 [Orbilia ellipsospora]|uniref:F-box domain-containing protein n=1 Tax=Orbilia ellipsospora TaxID=2528407 RepID=A0AAV9XK28_9PEZI
MAANPTLETLPYEIKLVILDQFPDYESVIALAIASRPFHTVFAKHKDTILDNLLLAKYEVEAIFIAYISEIGSMPNHPDTWIYAGTGMDSYEKHVSDGSELELPDFAISWLSTHNYAVIKENHKVILRAANFILQNERYPNDLVDTIGAHELRQSKKAEYLRSAPPATISEKNRLVRGFYYTWIFCVVHSHRYTARNRGSYAFQIPYSVMLGWGYWAAKTMQTIHAHLVKKFNEVFVTEWVKDFIPIPMEYLQNSDYCCSEPSITVQHPEHMHLIFHYDFTTIVSQIYNPDPDSLRQSLTKVQKILDTEPLAYRRDLWGPTVLRWPCFDKAIGWLAKITRIYFNIRDSSSREGRRILFVKRLVSPRNPSEEAVSWDNTWGARYLVSTGDEIQIAEWLEDYIGVEGSGRLAYWEHIWDDWRLESWGYEFPAFASQL